MAGTNVELFQSVQFHYKKLGIHPSKIDQPLWFYAKNLLYITPSVLCLISMIAYFYSEAQNMMEYSSVFSICIGILLAIVYFSVIIWKATEIFKLIEQFDQFIEMSRQNSKNSKNIDGNFLY